MESTKDNVWSDGKVFEDIESLNEGARAAVRMVNEQSALFDITVGLKQEYVMSPRLFHG